MDTINEWPNTPLVDEKASTPGAVPGRAQTQRPGSAPAPKAEASLNPDAIFTALKALSPEPVAVHLYAEDGFPWIRVSSDPAKPFPPSDALLAGEAISKEVQPVPVFFHALRATDVLFLLDRRMKINAEDADLPATSYGLPLDDVAEAWSQDAATLPAVPSKFPAPGSRRTGAGAKK
ncbi:hypothetical protein [Variovorax guangxiensis]|uniref:hypothetical protein n=1 Tax=Variovorax guangxiensis TaxID=1775474 RepID=UPI0028650B36|nr:hypothetical protein [Variovorax guangxiensis]MDR6859831.1 hypothetical protein [Variovorax guangxiensis]